MLAALLEAGCPANSPDIHGVYPLHYAVSESREPGEEYTEEGLVHSQNAQQCVYVLLEKRVPVDCQDAQGCTPLHYAAQLPSKCHRGYGIGKRSSPLSVLWRSLPSKYKIMHSVKGCHTVDHPPFIFYSYLQTTWWLIFVGSWSRLKCQGQ